MIKSGRTLLLLGAVVFVGGACRRVEEPPAAAPEAPHSGAGPASAEGVSPTPVARPPRKSAWVIFGADTVVAEVARTPGEREQGLMGRREVPDGTGMLFVYNEEEVLSFWMSNTPVALDVAFLDAGLRVVGIQSMEPETTDIHSSPRPVMFGLEVPRGWFDARGVRVGDQAVLVLGPL